jgi:hypothetical protein
MFYQKVTGPTYPKKVKTEFQGKEYNFKLLRSSELGSPCEISLPVDDSHIKALIIYKRYKVNEDWTTVEMKRDAKTGDLTAILPDQPPAGKIEYKIELYKGSEKAVLNNGEPVVIRFKGYVPRSILIPHVIFMILALLFGTRTGVELLFRRKNTRDYAFITLVSLGIGGLIFGPIVQYHAFGDYWTGWPFGSDWTDNKTLFAFIFWVVSVSVLKKNPKNILWPAIALIVMYSIYLIPHSTGGSELNPETGKVETGLK